MSHFSNVRDEMKGYRSLVYWIIRRARFTVSYGFMKDIHFSFFSPPLGG